MPTIALKTQSFRRSDDVFNAAIAQRVLSVEEGQDHYAADWMYMGDDQSGRAMFKHIVTREYMTAFVEV